MYTQTRMPSIGRSNAPSGRLIGWRIRSRKFDFEALHRLGLINQGPDALPRLQIQSDTQNCEPIDDKVPMFESSSDPLEEWMKMKRVKVVSISDNSFETMNVLKRFHTASHTPADGNLCIDFDTND